MNNIGKSERTSQNRVLELFQKELGYDYLGDWQEEIRTRPVEEPILKKHLLSRGYSETLSQKAVDELVVFDIDATVLGKEPNYSLIERLASQSMMPLCYGGGVKTVEQAQRIFSLGIEKIALSSAVLQNPKLITEISEMDQAG